MGHMVYLNLKNNLTSKKAKTKTEIKKLIKKQLIERLGPFSIDNECVTPYAAKL